MAKIFIALPWHSILPNWRGLTGPPSVTVSGAFHQLLAGSQPAQTFPGPGGWGGRGEWEAAPAPACSLCPSPVGRTTARGTPKREHVTQAACPIQPKGDGGSSTASSQTFPGLHSAFKDPVVPHSILLAYRVGLLTPLPRDFRGSLHCRRKPRSSSALKGAVTLHPASPQAGSLSAPAPCRVPGGLQGALFHLPDPPPSPSRPLCSSSGISTLAAPSSRKPVCARPPPCLPGRAGGLPLAPPGGPGLPGHSTELGSSQLDCPCLTLNSPGPRAGLLHSSWGGFRTILSAAEKPIYFVPWIVRTGWFSFPKYHISSVPPKHCFHIFTSLKLGWHVPA